jgi:glycerate 2-kinase
VVRLEKPVIISGKDLDVGGVCAPGRYDHHRAKMRVLVAPDKFKGSLTAQEVAETIGRAIRSVDSKIEVDLFPIADGGEGTAAVVAQHLAATRKITETLDPMGRPIEAESFVGDDVAILDMSAASGLWRLNAGERDPMHATTLGIGIQIRQLSEATVSRILVHLDGSATSAAGLGMAAAVGYKFYTSDGERILPCPARFADITAIEAPPLRPFPEVIGLSDVETTLTGLDGAIHTSGPRKGLNPSMVDQLDRELTELVARIESQLQRSFSKVPRSGAAGGLGYGILTFLHRSLVSGFDFLAASAKLHDHVLEADLVITGKGKLERQTLRGKGPFGIASMASNHHKPVWAIGGVLEDRQLLAPHFAKIISLVDEKSSSTEALRNLRAFFSKRCAASLSRAKVFAPLDEFKQMTSEAFLIGLCQQTEKESEDG